jgi:hypothetical protein
MQDRLKKIATISGLRDAELGALDEGFLDEDWDPAKYEVAHCMLSSDHATCIIIASSSLHTRL